MSLLMALWKGVDYRLAIVIISCIVYITLERSRHLNKNRYRKEIYNNTKLIRKGDN